MPGTAARQIWIKNVVFLYHYPTNKISIPVRGLLPKYIAMNIQEIIGGT